MAGPLKNDRYFFAPSLRQYIRIPINRVADPGGVGPLPEETGSGPDPRKTTRIRPNFDLINFPNKCFSSSRYKSQSTNPPIMVKIWIQSNKSSYITLYRYWACGSWIRNRTLQSMPGSVLISFCEILWSGSRETNLITCYLRIRNNFFADPEPEPDVLVGSWSWGVF